MFETKSDIEYKRNRVANLKSEIDKAISLCKDYISNNLNEFYSPSGENLLDLINQLELLKRNLSDNKSLIEYRNLLEKVRNSKKYALAQQVNFAKEKKQGQNVKYFGKDYVVPYVEGLYSSLKNIENIYFREINLVPKWNRNGETFEDYSKRLAFMVDDYDCKIAELESKRFFKR